MARRTFWKACHERLHREAQVTWGQAIIFLLMTFALIAVTVAWIIAPAPMYLALKATVLIPAGAAVWTFAEFISRCRRIRAINKQLWD